MRCPKCGVSNKEGRKFCSKCGAKLENVCPECGFRNEQGDAFCGGYCYTCSTSTRDIYVTQTILKHPKMG